MTRLHLKGLLVTLSFLALLACTEEDSNPCDSKINTGTLDSPSTGVVTMQGSFPSDESVLAAYTYQGQEYLKTGTVAGNTITYSGLPAGVLSIDFLVSCKEVELNRPTLGVGIVTVK